MRPQLEPLPPTPATVAPLARPRRDRLIAAIAAVVAEEGYGRTSVSKVATAAGVSRNTFYEHFANKEECFLAAYDTVVDAALARIRSAVATAPDREQALVDGLAAFLDLLAAQPAIAWLCLVEAPAAGARALERRDAALRTFGALLADAGGDDGDAPTLAPVAAEVVVGGICELIYARTLASATDTLPALLPDLVYVWVSATAGTARASAMRAAAARRLGLDAPALVRSAPEPGRPTRT